MPNFIQDLMAMKGNLAAYHTIVKGEFDKEIARLETLMKSLEDRMGMVKTVEDAQAKAAAIVSEAQKMKDTAAAQLKDAEASSVAAAAIHATAAAKTNLARELELKVKNDWDELVKAKAAHALHVDSINANLTQAQNDLNTSAAAVATQQEAIDAKAAKIAAAMKSA